MTMDKDSKELIITLVKIKIKRQLSDAIEDVLHNSLDELPNPFIEVVEDAYPRPIDLVYACVNEIVEELEEVHKVDEEEELQQRMAALLVKMFF